MSAKVRMLDIKGEMMDNYVYGNGYERLMEIKMTKKSVKKQIVTATIYNTSVKTKSQLRSEGEVALAKFLKAGGTIEVGKPAKARKSKMAAKNSRGFQAGTSGFASGFPRRSFGS